MHVVVLHNEVTEDSSIPIRDVLVQRKAVTDSLRRLGHTFSCVTCDLDLRVLKSRLVDLRPDILFNLVESLGGSDLLMPVPTMLLDALGIPYTGSGTEAIFATTHKLVAKERILRCGLRTPDWISQYSTHIGPPKFASGMNGKAHPGKSPRRFIIKSITEHASVGIDDTAVVEVKSTDEIRELLTVRESETGRAHFAEQFIDGREFNIALLADRADEGARSAHPDVGYPWAGTPQVLPPSEIEFRDFPHNKPRIVGYRAKWEESSFEYMNTPRQFDFAPSDRPLVLEMVQQAVRCWNEFGLRGYARVDFRVDGNGQPWVLEVNANPCIAPDGGFASSLARAEIAYDAGIARIIHDALSGPRWHTMHHECLCHDRDSEVHRHESPLMSRDVAVKSV